MNYRLREHATKILKLEAEILSELESMIEESDNGNGVGLREFTKLQADQIYWQNRFARVVYLEGVATGE